VFISSLFVGGLWHASNEHKGSLWPPWPHIQATEFQLYSFLTSALHTDEWLTSRPCHSHTENNPNPLLNTSLGWTPNLVWTLWRIGKWFAATDIRTPYRPACSLVTKLTELPLILLEIDSLGFLSTSLDLVLWLGWNEIILKSITHDLRTEERRFATVSWTGHRN